MNALPRPTDKPPALLGESPETKSYRCLRSTVVRLVAKPNFQSVRASVYEVSVRHISLVTEKAFHTGTVLALLFQTRQAGMSGILSARVRSRRELQHERWLLDCTLSRRLSQDEIQALI
jgi:hypothetical protein